MSVRSNRLLVQIAKSSGSKLSTRSATTSAVISHGGQKWSRTISLTSPESDFTAAIAIRSVTSTTAKAKSKKDEVPPIAIPTWSENISFTSPEADFITSSYRYGSMDLDTTVENESSKNWSETMSFASPESDFTGIAYNAGIDTSSSSQATKEDFINHLRREENHRNNMAYSIPYASAESDFSNAAFMNLLDDRQKKQLDNCTLLDKSEKKNELSEKVNPRELQLTSNEAAIISTFIELDKTSHPETSSTTRTRSFDIYHEGPLPHTLKEASLPDDPRAIVVTEAEVPFRITKVNDSWEKLCGYTFAECQGKTLECLQGPETNKAAITALMSQLMHGEEAGTVLTNYTKLGRKFHNRLRVGPLKNHSGATTHFVGVLCEVNEKGEHFLESSGSSQMKM